MEHEWSDGVWSGAWVGAIYKGAGNLIKMFSSINIFKKKKNFHLNNFDLNHFNQLEFKMKGYF